MAKKKGKKGKKEKAPPGPTPVTTAQIIQDRTKMLCPRMGDIYDRNEQVEMILEDVAEKCLYKAIDKKLDEVCLSSLKLRKMPIIEPLTQELSQLFSINLSKNNLFDGDQVFQVRSNNIILLLTLTACVIQALSCLPQLQKLNLSENFLNGTLSEFAGLLAQLEVMNLDVNNLTSLCPAVQNWRRLKVFTISDNSLTGKSLLVHNCY